MPASASRLSARNAGTSSTRLRAKSPTTTATSETRVHRCGPTALASRGAAAPKTAKATTGSDVRMPASVPDMSRPARISSSTGPTLTAAGRRLNARTAMPSSTRPRPARRDCVTKPLRVTARRPPSTLARSSSRVPSLSMTYVAIARRSSRPACASDPGLGLLAGPAAVADHPLDLQPGSASTTITASKVSARPDSASSGMSWTTRSPGRGRRLERDDPLEDQRVHDRLEPPAPPSSANTIRPIAGRSSSPSGREQLGAELRDHLLQARGALRDHLAGELRRRRSHRAQLARMADTELLPEATPPVSPTRTGLTDDVPAPRSVQAPWRLRVQYRGDRVALLVPGSHAYLDAVLRLLAAGVFPIPLDPRLTASERERILARPRPRPGRRGRGRRWRRSPPHWRARAPAGPADARAPAARRARRRASAAGLLDEDAGGGAGRRGARPVGLRRATTSTWC